MVSRRVLAAIDSLPEIVYRAEIRENRGCQTAKKIVGGSSISLNSLMTNARADNTDI